MLIGSDDTSEAQKAKEDRIGRRRIDTEIQMLQSDRSRFQRQSEEMEAQIRMMEKDITDRTYLLEARKKDRSRALQQVQDIDAEIIRVKRSAYKK